MKDSELSVSELKELMAAFRENGLGSFSLKQGQYELSIEGPKVEQVIPPPWQMQQQCAPTAQQQSVETPAAAEEPCREGTIVTSPIVGTFFERPAPDQSPFVKVGQKVKQGDVLFIIESMKLMNEVLCECDGVVAEILVQDAQPVEYGEPILRLE